MQKTTNFELNKIELTDAPADITVLNPNWDKIDETLKEHDGRTDYITSMTVTDGKITYNKKNGTKGITTIRGLPVTGGGTGADNADDACTNLSLDTAIVDLSVNDANLKYTRRNGTSGIVQIQDVDTTSRLDRLIEENTFRSRALCKALQNDVSFLVVECYESSIDIDTTIDDGQTVVDTMFNAPFHSIDKTGDGSVTFQCLPKVNVKSNLYAWVWADYIGTGTCEVEISRDNGTTFTTIPNDSLVSISSQPEGNNLICRVTLSGEITLKNISWGVK